MNAITKEQKLTVAQDVRLIDLIQQAARGFRERVKARTGGDPTDTEIDNFVRKVEPSIVLSILKADANHSNAKRDDRLKTVKALAADNGVKFVHRREIEETDVQSTIDALSVRGYTEIIDVEFVNATRGGQTLAFKYVLDEKNNLSMIYTVAFCRNDENFDPLIGMEESLKKFLAGRVLTAGITHERFGHVKLTQLSNEYKAAELTAKAILEQTA